MGQAEILTFLKNRFKDNDCKYYSSKELSQKLKVDLRNVNRQLKRLVEWKRAELKYFKYPLRGYRLRSDKWKTK